jgi:hypothetical protein
MSFKISRRHLISGTGHILLLPLLESLVPFNRAYAAGENDPRRYVGVYFPNGGSNRKNDAIWYPATGPMSAAGLPIMYQSFASNIGDFSVLKNIQHRSRQQVNDTYGGSHISSVITHFTGEFPGTNPKSTDDCVIRGTSIDQIVANASGKKSLNLSGGGVNSTPDKSSGFAYGYYLSYNQGKKIEPNMNVVDVYKNILSQVMTSPKPPPSPSPAPAGADPGKSRLDAVVGDIKALQKKLGRKDVAKLDDYLTGVRSMEVKSSPGAGGMAQLNCVAPPAPADALNHVDTYCSLPDYIPRMQAMFDAVAFAFKCDITRSVCIGLDGDGAGRILNTGTIPSNIVYQGALPDDNLHTISHDADKGGVQRSKIVTRDRLFLSFVFRLVDQLKAATDVSGSRILDNTLIDAGHGVRDCNHQDGQEAGTPMIIAGGCNFASPGNSYDVGAYDRRDLLYTVARLMNTGISDFQGSKQMMKI